MAGGNQILDVLDKEPDRYSLDSLVLWTTVAIFADVNYRKMTMDLNKQIIGIDRIGSTDPGIEAMALYFSPDDEECSKAIYDLSPRVCIVDEKSKKVKIGELGKIIKDADWTSLRYYKDENPNKKTFKEIDGKRWFICDEEGTVVEGNRFIITKGAVPVKIGGKEVRVQKIDNTIGKHPAIKIAGSIGIPDEKLGERIMTAVELKEGEKTTEDEIKEFCKGKMEEYEIPKHIVFLKENEIPVTRYGVVRYGPLKNMLKEKGYL